MLTDYCLRCYIHFDQSQSQIECQIPSDFTLAVPYYPSSTTTLQFIHGVTYRLNALMQVENTTTTAGAFGVDDGSHGNSNTAAAPPAQHSSSSSYKSALPFFADVVKLVFPPSGDGQVNSVSPSRERNQQQMVSPPASALRSLGSPAHTHSSAVKQPRKQQSHLHQQHPQSWDVVGGYSSPRRPQKTSSMSPLKQPHPQHQQPQQLLLQRAREKVTFEDVAANDEEYEEFECEEEIEEIEEIEEYEEEQEDILFAPQTQQPQPPLQQQREKEQQRRERSEENGHEDGAAAATKKMHPSQHECEGNPADVLHMLLVDALLKFNNIGGTPKTTPVYITYTFKRTSPGIPATELGVDHMSPHRLPQWVIESDNNTAHPKQNKILGSYYELTDSWFPQQQPKLLHDENSAGGGNSTMLAEFGAARVQTRIGILPHKTVGDLIEQMEAKEPNRPVSRVLDKFGEWAVCPLELLMHVFQLQTDSKGGDRRMEFAVEFVHDRNRDGENEVPIYSTFRGFF